MMYAEERQSVLRNRARRNPDGLTPYRYTQGFTKADALQFWVDAKTIGLVVVGRSPRGAKVLALPAEGPGACEACEIRQQPGGSGQPCPKHSGDIWAGSW